jgi:prevent-host-death family protein
MTILVMYKRCMRAINIADLKSHLSSYLNEVREGAEIIIRDRQVPIAKLVPLSGVEEMNDEERALVATGKLRPPEEPLPDSFFDMPAPRITRARIQAALRVERDED